ncbi:hypothetical protein D3C85_1763760 [compost metagenome]
MLQILLADAAHRDDPAEGIEHKRQILSLGGQTATGHFFAGICFVQGSTVH